MAQTKKQVEAVAEAIKGKVVDQVDKTKVLAEKPTESGDPAASGKFRRTEPVVVKVNEGLFS